MPIIREIPGAHSWDEIIPIEAKLAPNDCNQVLPEQKKTIKENVIDKSFYTVEELKTRKNVNYD